MAKTPVQEREELIKYLLESGEIISLSVELYQITGHWYANTFDEIVDQWLRQQFKDEKN